MRDLENRTIGEIAIESPAATRVFEEYKIDYCCHGDVLFYDACQMAGASYEIIEQKVVDVVNSPEGQTRELLADLSFGDLIDYISKKHHGYTKREMDLLTPLMKKVVSRHGGTYPDLHEMLEVFHQICDDLAPHFMKEELVLFPYIIGLETKAAKNKEVRRPHFGTVRNPIRTLKEEHAVVGILLAKLRELANDYKVPDGACMSFNVLFQRLASLELDLHQHIHLENNVLFPRACEIEEKIFGKNAT